MKKILLLVLAISTFASDVKIYKYIDEMTEETSYLASHNAVIKNYEKGRGFSIRPYIDDSAVITGITITHIGFGCSEKDQLIILLENGQKIKLTSWNDFNCKGDSYFRVNQANLYKLKSSPLKKAMFRNGENYKSLTQDFEQIDKDYFIRVISIVERRAFSTYEEK